MHKLPFPESLLHKAQLAGIHPDSKTLVDRPISISPSALIESWTNTVSTFGEENLENELEQFLERVALPAGSDLREVDPLDWRKKDEEWLARAGAYRHLAKVVDEAWIRLCRQTIVSEEDRTTLIPLPKPFFVPGDRFREIYYWDSYWTVKGLLISEMFESALNQVENLVVLLERFGFVPNGSRTYYLNRSQPPLLSGMIRLILEEAETNEKISEELRQRAIDISKKAMSLLVTESQYWSSPPHSYCLRTPTNKTYYLSRYNSTTKSPRPESYREDIETASHAEDKERICKEISAAAESGFDFSSRWFEDVNDMTTIQTTKYIPADLNAFLHKSHVDTAFIASKVGEQEVVSYFQQKAADTERAFERIFWDRSSSQWRDLKTDDSEGYSFNRLGYLSNFVPLACGLKPPPDSSPTEIVKALRNSGLWTESGFMTSIYHSGQQWDAPNIWPPLQSLLVNGLLQLEKDHPHCGAKELANEITTNFLDAVAAGHSKTGFIFEKYSGLYHGTEGIGGEYVAQMGFGWTIGTTLELIRLSCHKR